MIVCLTMNLNLKPPGYEPSMLVTTPLGHLVLLVSLNSPFLLYSWIPSCLGNYKSSKNKSICIYILSLFPVHIYNNTLTCRCDEKPSYRTYHGFKPSRVLSAVREQPSTVQEVHCAVDGGLGPGYHDPGGWWWWQCIRRIW